jgi:Ca2+-transporting ATPase
LGKLINPKSLDAFYALGGLSGLEKGLRSDRAGGLSSDETALDGYVSFEEATGAAVHREKGSVTVERSTSTTQTGTDGTAPTPRVGSPNCPFANRILVYKANHLPERKSKSILQLAWITYNDKVLILLTVAAVISLALGLYQTFRTHKNGEARVEWVEGVAIVAAIVIVVTVGALNDWQKERQFVKLSKKIVWSK